MLRPASPCARFSYGTVNSRPWFLPRCNGVSQNTFVSARRLASWGYAALIIDTFNPRGLKRAARCAERAQDAFEAAAYLRSRPESTPERIAVLGYSHGGWTALNASTEKGVKRAKAPPFRATIAYYPFCPEVAPPLQATSRFSSVTATTGHRPCVRPLWKNIGHRPTLMVYSGARHAFDISRTGIFRSSIGLRPEGKHDALDRTRKFLDQRMQRE